MRSTYLDLADHVLRSARSPLRAKEIIEIAHDRHLLPSHIYGLTPDRTLQARLSEDIAVHRERSRFFRTSPGRFFLRDMASSVQARTPALAEYYAKPRWKDIVKTNILAVDTTKGNGRSTLSSRISIGEFSDIMKSGNYRYADAQDINNSENLSAVHSFVIVFRERSVLSYRLGKLADSKDHLYGKRSIGFGGPVTFNDSDMLSDSFYGIVSNALKELSASLGLPRFAVRNARYENEVRPWLAIKSPKTASAAAAIHLVMAYRFPEGFAPSGTSLLVNDLRWINMHNPSNNLSDFDSISEFLFSEKFIPDLLFWSTS